MYPTHDAHKFYLDESDLARRIFICRVKTTKGIIRSVAKYWEIIADNLHDAGWSLGWVSAMDREGQTIWIVDAHGYGKRFIVRAEEKLSAFVELERQALTVTFYLESIQTDLPADAVSRTRIVR